VNAREQGYRDGSSGRSTRDTHIDPLDFDSYLEGYAQALADEDPVIWADLDYEYEEIDYVTINA